MCRSSRLVIPVQPKVSEEDIYLGSIGKSSRIADG